MLSLVFLIFLNTENEFEKSVQTNTEILKKYLKFEYKQKDKNYDFNCKFCCHVYKKFLQEKIFFVTEMHNDVKIKDNYIGFFNTFAVRSFYTKNPKYSKIFDENLVRSVVELNVLGLTELDITNNENKNVIENYVIYCFAHDLSKNGINLEKMGFEYIDKKK